MLLYMYNMLFEMEWYEKKELHNTDRLHFFRCFQTASIYFDVLFLNVLVNSVRVMGGLNKSGQEKLKQTETPLSEKLAMLKQIKIPLSDKSIVEDIILQAATALSMAVKLEMPPCFVVNHIYKFISSRLRLYSYYNLLPNYILNKIEFMDSDYMIQRIKTKEFYAISEVSFDRDNIPDKHIPEAFQKYFFPISTINDISRFSLDIICNFDASTVCRASTMFIRKVVLYDDPMHEEMPEPVHDCFGELHTLVINVLQTSEFKCVKTTFESVINKAKIDR